MKRIITLIGLFCIVNFALAKPLAPRLILKLSDDAADQMRYQQVQPEFVSNLAVVDLQLVPIFYEPGDLEHREIWRNVGLHRWFRLEQKTSSAEALAARLSKNSELLDFYLSYPQEAMALPDDFSNFDMWGLTQMHCPEAWSIFRNVRGGPILVTTIDTGCRIQHPDLAANIRVNPGEDLNDNGVWDASDNNGVDDDNNGFIDDLSGWDFVTYVPDPSEMAIGEDYSPADKFVYPDVNGHGTHVAGTSAGVTNNNLGVPAASWNVKSMPLRAGFAWIDGGGTIRGSGYPVDFSAAIQYAADNGTKIISISFGGSSFDQAYQDAVTYARSLHVIVFASAGNNNNNTIQYPAGFTGVISVAATDVGDVRSSFSTYGTWVDIAAPGSGIWSTMSNNTYHQMDYARYNGTSMACPNTAAVAALLWSYDPCLVDTQVINILLSTCDNINAQNPGFNGLLGAGRVNALRALQAVGRSAEVTNVSATDDRCDSVVVTWNIHGESMDSIFVLRDGLQVGALRRLTPRFAEQPPSGRHQYSVYTAYNCGASPAVSDSGSMIGFGGTDLMFSATDTSCEYVALWYAVPPTATEMEIWVGQNADIVDHIVTEPVAAPWVFWDLPRGRYLIALRFSNECNQITQSDSARRLEGLTTTTVQNVYATDNRCDSIIVTWNPVVDADTMIILRDNVVVAALPCHCTRYADAPGLPGPYIYQVIAANSCGRSLPGSFSGILNLALPPVQNVMATDALCDSVIITWNDLLLELSYVVLRNGRQIAMLIPNTTFFVDHPAPGSYQYTVMGLTVCGASPVVSDSGRAFGPMPTVQNVQATDNNCESVTIMWTNPMGEDSLRVFRDAQWIATLPPNSVQYIDMPPVGAYRYSVLSYNACGASPMAADSGHRRGPLPAVLNVAATDNRCDSIIVTWTNPAGEDSFRILRNGVQIAARPANAVRFTDAPPAGSYQYSVIALNACGASPAASDSGRKFAPLTAVANVAATDDRCDSVIVTWSDPVGADSVWLWRDNNPLARMAPHAARYADQPVPGLHRYTVYGYNLCGMSPAASDTGRRWYVLPAVVNVHATDDRCDSVLITWANPAGEDSFRILRNGAVIATTPPNWMRYTDAPPAIGGFEYSVLAVNRCGDSPATSDSGHVVSLIAIDPLPANVLCGSILRVTASHCAGADRDSVFFRLGGSGSFELVRVDAPVRDVDTVMVPRIPVQLEDSCQVKIVSCRDGRCDVAYSTLFAIACPGASVEGDPVTVTDYFLDQNYPNPFNPSTTIAYGLPRESVVLLEIYDMLGRRVTTLAEGRMPAGLHQVVWNCSGCPTGMYLIRLQTDERVMLRKTLLMK